MGVSIAPSKSTIGYQNKNGVSTFEWTKKYVA